MQIIEEALNGVVLLEPKVFGDDRGFFMETFNQRVFCELTGVAPDFVQDNHSRSADGVRAAVSSCIPSPRASPKSVTRGRPSLPTSTFSGLKTLLGA